VLTSPSGWVMTVTAAAAAASLSENVG
jgi:hypothetical protein